MSALDQTDKLALTVNKGIRERITAALRAMPEGQTESLDFLDKYKEFLGMRITVELEGAPYEMVFVPLPGKPFFIGTEMVSKHAYREVIKHEKYNDHFFPSNDGLDEPQTDISWNKISNFANHINNITVRRTVNDRSRSEQEPPDNGRERYQGTRRWGFGLPTEAELKFVFPKGCDEKYSSLYEWLYDEDEKGYYGSSAKLVGSDYEGTLGKNDSWLDLGFRLVIDAADWGYISDLFFHPDKYPHLREENEVIRKQREIFEKKVDSLKQLEGEADAWWGQFQENIQKRKDQQFEDEGGWAGIFETFSRAFKGGEQQDHWERMRTFFENLFGDGKGATSDEQKQDLSELKKAKLKRLHRKLAKKFHPDTSNNDGKLFKKVQSAFEGDNLATLEEMADQYLTEEDMES
jgi:hypothetical protein